MQIASQVHRDVVQLGKDRIDLDFERYYEKEVLTRRDQSAQKEIVKQRDELSKVYFFYFFIFFGSLIVICCALFSNVPAKRK